ncbi:MAG: hypothetical protein IT335_10825 [Thermomicrobiales bacterium]|nr:hypothetical protein [Thermomicrobiales bacterium]
MEAADAILRVTVNNLVQGIRLVSIERGYDPRSFSLSPFGGAGAMYGVDVAEALSIPEVVVPLHPGVTSALGLLQVDLKQDLMRSVLMVQGDIDLDRLSNLYGELEAEANELLEGAGIPAERRVLRRQADVRYFGQSKYMTVAVPDGEVDSALVSALIENFSQEHKREYGYTMPPHIAEIEIANVRLAAIGQMDRPTIVSARASRPASGATASRPVYFTATGFVDTPVRWRDELAQSESLPGPLVIEQADATTVVSPGWVAVVDPLGNLIISQTPAESDSGGRHVN